MNFAGLVGPGWGEANKDLRMLQNPPRMVQGARLTPTSACQCPGQTLQGTMYLHSRGHLHSLLLGGWTLYLDEDIFHVSLLIICCLEYCLWISFLIGHNKSPKLYKFLSWRHGEGRISTFLQMDFYLLYLKFAFGLPITMILFYHTSTELAYSLFWKLKATTSRFSGLMTKNV